MSNPVLGERTQAIALDKVPDDARDRGNRAGRVTGLACAVGLVALFSGFNLVSRQGFTTPLTLPDIVALRFGIGAAVLAPLLLRRRLAGIRLRDAIGMACLGGLGFALFAYGGLSLAPAAHAAVLMHGCLPLFTTLLAVTILGERMEQRRSAAIALIAAGIVLMAVDSLEGTSARQIAGDLCLLGASLCWSSYGLFARRLGVAPAHAAALVVVISAACFLPVYLLLPDKGVMVASWPDILLQALFQGVLIGAASIFIYTRAVLALGATETALFMAAVPCVTTLAAIPWLGEVPSTVTWLGVVATTVGMIVAVPHPKVPRAREREE